MSRWMRHAVSLVELSVHCSVTLVCSTEVSARLLGAAGVGATVGGGSWKHQSGGLSDMHGLIALAVPAGSRMADATPPASARARTRVLVMRSMALVAFFSSCI